MTPVRYRCAACGNLTRFDVTVTRRIRAFHHYSLGGDLTVEETEVLAETVEEVVCRWCSSAKTVEAVPAGEVETTGEAVPAGADVPPVPDESGVPQGSGS